MTDGSELAQSHRPRHGVALGLFTAMVTRIIPTSSPEAKGEGCLKALLKETTKLRYRAVWDESLVEEWSAVRKQDPNATCGRVFSILEEKNAERHDPEGEREYKALIVRRERDSNRVRRCLALVVSRDVQRPGCDGIH